MRKKLTACRLWYTTSLHNSLGRPTLQMMILNILQVIYRQKFS